MNVAAVSATADSQASSSVAQNSLGPDQFLTLLIAELQTQDPLSPMDTQALVAQLSTMEMVAESRAARQSQEMTQALGLLGRTVQWEDTETGTLSSGKVTSVRRVGSEAMVAVGDKQLKLDELVAIF